MELVMRHISIIGSTGSIGKSTLKIARHLKDSIKVEALAAKSNIELLEVQAKEFNPNLIAVFDENKALQLQKKLPNIEVVAGIDGLKAVASYSKSDFIVSAMTGTLGIIPTIEALNAKKTVGLANKEALVSGGALIMSLAKKYNLSIIPIDSEHSALFQCLVGEDINKVERLILTASGGPFRSYSYDDLKNISVEKALHHPTWTMGPKVTIDSSTLMNKGLEVIEAHWLFNIPYNKIDVVIHPQSIIHSMVEYVDNSIIAQMGDPDMITPIQYALTYPERKPGLLNKFDFLKHSTLQFYQPDLQKFKCLRLAFDAMKEGGSLSCYMNAANEVLVNRFLDKQIGWLDISNKLENLMAKQSVTPINSLNDILEIDALARQEALRH